MLVYNEHWLPQTNPNSSEFVLSSNERKRLPESTGIEIGFSGIAENSSLEVGENLREQPRRPCNKIKQDLLNASLPMWLKIAADVIVDTIGDSELIPSRLVFKTILQFPMMFLELPLQKERMKALANYHMEMNSIIAKQKHSTALSKKVSQSADHIYHIGDKALVHSKNAING